MTKKNWTKKAIMIGFLTLIVIILIFLYGIPITETFTEAAKYFSYTLVILLAFFAYFEFLKE